MSATPFGPGAAASLRLMSLLIVASVACAQGPAAALDHPQVAAPIANRLRQTPVFVSGQDGFHTYRIPAVARTPGAVLLAFCEGRRAAQGDAGDIALLLKRSTDQGATWDQQHIVRQDAGNTCGNPSPVVDLHTGVVWLLSTWNRGEDSEAEIINGTSRDTRRVFVQQSSDQGLTWAAPRDITAQVKRPDWTWYATGPGAGVQLVRGVHRGRLVIPCDHIEAGSKHYYSHVIYSDDHGATWQLGGRTPKHQVNECQVVERADGQLLLNMRNYDRTQRRRQIATSPDGGLSWSNQRFDDALVEPTCQASIRRCGAAILFSNPADGQQRVRLTVRASLDDAVTWNQGLVLHPGPAAYSDLVDLDHGLAGCLYERGRSSPYEEIVFAHFPVASTAEADPD